MYIKITLQISITKLPYQLQTFQ